MQANTVTESHVFDYTVSFLHVHGDLPTDAQIFNLLLIFETTISDAV